ncbi:nucleotide exchange factor GrpE, partial [Candidatus Nomurabacteria bacterium]|nr:nucleotide exchange factor GrpE [Candidatus Nomurabacteria bacterium]
MSDEEIFADADPRYAEGSGEARSSGETKKKDAENKEDSTESEVVEFEFNDDPEGKDTSYGASGEEELIKKLQKLKLELKACRKEKEEYLTGWQKERADFANYKKLEDDRKAMFSEVVRERILSRFLAVIDSFNMAFANKEAWEKVDANWRRGVEHIYSQMNGIFEEYGVKPVGTLGEAFDPNI